MEAPAVGTVGTATTYEDVIDKVLRPKNLQSLKDPLSKPIQVLIFANPNSQAPTDEITIQDMYPFQTVSDLCTRIYIEKGERDEYHPENQCLLVPLADSTKYKHFQYVFNDDRISLASPLTISQPNPEFVDATGNAKLVKITSRMQLLLETALFHEKSTTLHLYLYSTLYQNYRGLKPVNRSHWEGIFRPYFPEHQKGQQEDGSLTKEADEYKETLVKRLTCRQQMIELLNTYLEKSRSDEVRLRKPGESARENASVSNIRNLRFIWKKPPRYAKYKIFDIESVFYDTPVSKGVPYIRFYPKTAEPISKVHVEGAFNIPSLEKPEILLQWSETKSVSPEENLIMMKVLLRPGSGSVNPLYATMYIHQDGSAKFIIQPDADTKALNHQADLFNLPDVLTRVTDSLPKLYPESKESGLLAKQLYTPNDDSFSLEDAYIVLSIWLEKDDETFPITKKNLQSVLPFYRPFFQVSSSPLQFQNPITFLRYKGVDNFQIPARDFQFLHRVIDLQKMNGKTSIPDLAKYYMEEFDVPESVAQARVGTFLSDMTKFDLTDPITLEYKPTINPGIDIALFGKQPFYTLHIYRVNSIINLQRIKTLLSLMLSLDVKKFEEIRKCYLTVAEEEEEAQGKANEEAEEEAEGALEESGEVPSASEVAAANAAFVDTFAPNSQQAFAWDDLEFNPDAEEAVNAKANAANPAKAPKPLQTLAAVEADADSQPGDADSDADADADPDADADDDNEEITDVTQLKKTKAKTYFLKRLNFYDQRLFQYTKDHPSLKKYSSMCAANALKQPIVIGEDEFTRIKEIYENDVKQNKLKWIEYPLTQAAKTATRKSKEEKEKEKEKEREKKKSLEGPEEISVLRYGSNLLKGQANIYICSRYWCRQDDIVILEKEFEGDVGRNGRSKPKYTCPFCRNGLVKNRLEVVKGETVIDRAGGGSSKKTHLYVRFLKKRVHPDGLYLPCCFLKPKEISLDNEPAFAHLKKAAPVASASASASAQIQDESSIQFKGSYANKLKNPKNWYIVGSEKLPLEVLKEGPQIGILHPNIDKYFAQDSQNLVVNDHTVWKLITKKDNVNATGFLRIAVENRKRYQADSFLSAIAPFYGEDSSIKMRKSILEKLVPSVFISLNYGNFLFDFYNPAIPYDSKDLAALMSFSKQLHMYAGTGIKKEALLRCWKAYTNFKIFMNDPTKTKEFRHFAKFLTLPNMLNWIDKDESVLQNGIIFIILELSEKDGSLQVRCPPYGISPMEAERCDVAFIIHYSSGIWEPILYTDNYTKTVEGEEVKISETYMVFRRDAQDVWPQIVKKRVKEYQEMCYSSGLGFYTDSPSLNPKTLLPLSIAMKIRGAEVKAVLRDFYNHISSLLFENDKGLILVPVIDDGTINPDLGIELDWQNFMSKLATSSDVTQFYNTHLKAILDTQPPEIIQSYQIERLIRLDKTVTIRDDIYAIHLANGLFVPVKKSEDNQLPIEEGQEVYWDIDRKLVYGTKEPAASIYVSYQDFEEIYQHLRYSFANWYAALDTTKTNLKKEITEILFHNGKPNNYISLYEKRQRLLIKVGTVILSWLDSSIPQIDKKASLKRVDCRLLVKDQCSNRCVWKSESESCLLHVPEKYDVGTNTQVNAKTLMVKKLIEELIRFPLKREELLKKRVSQYIKLNEAFLSGNEYILPENSVEWSELLRFEWRKNDTEKPKYIEEITSIHPKMKELSHNSINIEDDLDQALGVPQSQAPESASAPAPQPEAAASASASASQHEAPASASASAPQDEAPAASIWEIKPFPEIIAKYMNYKPTLNKFTYFESSSMSILPIIEFLGISLDDLNENGQDFDSLILSSQEVCDYVASRLKFSILQVAYSENTPVDPEITISIVSVDNKTDLPFLFIVQLDNGEVGMISSSSETILPIDKKIFLGYKNIMRKIIDARKSHFQVISNLQ
jgi:hypothetical protein